MSSEYKKLSSRFKCPICGKFDCKGYGSGKGCKKFCTAKERNILNKINGGN